MEDEERGPRLSKRFEEDKGGGEVDYKSKAGTAWSHNFLNQKPWHPLSYQNQRRKWIAEQTHAQHQRRAEEVAREYAQEQDFFRQNALISKKEKEKVETMKAVSFMYVRPPGYDPESAKAAEIADQMRKQKGSVGDQEVDGPSLPVPVQPTDNNGGAQGGGDGKKKRRPRDLYGRTLPTEEEFDVLKNAPKMDTGILGRARPFGIEIRNVKCLRCGTFGHQSGDRECPLKDTIMPNEEKRLKRDDPLNAIIAQSDAAEPLKWELKQKPGLSPPRGGYNSDDPNQQIVAEEIFDEYGGFLEGGAIPDLLANFTAVKHEKKSKRKSKHKRRSTASSSDSSLSESDSDGKKSKRMKHKMKKSKSSKSSKKSRSKHSDSDEDQKGKSKGTFESDYSEKKAKLRRPKEHPDLDGDVRRSDDSLSESEYKKRKDQGKNKSRHAKNIQMDDFRRLDAIPDSEIEKVRESKYHKSERRYADTNKDDRHKHRYHCSSSDEDRRRKSNHRRGSYKYQHSESDRRDRKLECRDSSDDNQLLMSDEDKDRSRSTMKLVGNHRSRHHDTNADYRTQSESQHNREDHRTHTRH